MQVSVLIPAYNCSKYIGAAIESVLSQTFQDFEIIVVDDGSEDETASIVKKYEGVHYVYQEHAGVSAARNRALKEARYELIDFLDADDLMLPEKLEKQIHYLDENPGCEIVFCQYENFLDLEESEVTPRHRQLMEKNDNHRLAGALMRISLFKHWGDFNVRMNYGEDTEWLMGIEVGGININHFVNEVLYLRRICNENISLLHPRIKFALPLKAQALRRAMKKSREST